MIVVPSTLSGVLNDLPRYVKESEDVMGYIICDRVAIWDPVWVNPRSEVLAPVRFNMDYIERASILTLSMPLTGGTIVNNVGDIGLLVISNDMYSKWEIAAMHEIVRYLKLRYNIDATIAGNDVLIDGKKFIGTSNGFINGNRRLAAMFISMNDDTAWLIKKICIKENKHTGFVGLNRYNVCPRKLITRMLRFTRKWEARAL